MAYTNRYKTLLWAMFSQLKYKTAGWHGIDWAFLLIKGVS